ncbi:hypothetical protein Pelo_11040 [Pelomyxa schiedti]|nr:hypothetical protein Pelo_11040 [Pelomyxa schiedti]
MPSGNGNRAKQKRERNQAKMAQQTTAKSQLRVNEKAKTIVCKICKQSFLCTASATDLNLHATNRHPKLPYSDCF